MRNSTEDYKLKQPKPPAGSVASYETRPGNDVHGLILRLPMIQMAEKR